MLTLTFIVVLTIFTIAILVAGRIHPEVKQISARFANLQQSTSLPGGGLMLPSGLLREAERVDRGWMEPLLSRLAGALKLDLLFQQADVETTTKKFLLTCAGAGFGAAFVAYVVFPVTFVALPVGAAASYVPFAVLKFRRDRRILAFDNGLPDVIETMSRSLRAGHSLIAAISIVAEQATEPARTEFSEVFRKQNFGLPLRDALLQLLDRVPSQDLRVLVTGILVQKDTGGNLTQILDRTASVIRERLKLEGEIRVHTAQGRMTGWILCLLPFVMLITINIINPGYSKTLTENPLGRKFLYAGGVLLSIGAFLIKRIVSSIEI